MTTDLLVWGCYAALFFLFYLATPFGGYGSRQ